MKLKKANATFGLLTIALLLAHAGYEVITFSLMLYDPVVTKVIGWSCMAVVGIHAILGMSIMMFAHDGSDLWKYPKENRRTILQRGSAIGILVMIALHLKCFDLIKSGTAGLVAAEVIQVLFFACVFTHIALSFSNAFVTLGVLEDLKKKQRIDAVASIICGICFIVAAFVIGRTYVIMASMPM